MRRPYHISPPPPANVVPIRPGAETLASPFDRLTATLIMEHHRRGELDPAVLAALLAGVGLEVPR